jgi:hypothetical protein
MLKWNGFSPLHWSVVAVVGVWMLLNLRVIKRGLWWGLRKRMEERT